MRLVRYGSPGEERPGVLAPDGQLLDAGALVPDWSGPFLAPGVLASVARRMPDLQSVPLDHRLGPPVAQPTKIVCIGLNYRDHARETGTDLPSEPVVFLKDPSTIVGPRDTVLLPRTSQKTDYEVELAVIVGTTARYLESVDQALACIAGYAVRNDLSERSFQLERGGQWDKGNSCETFNPLGPRLLTSDEVDDPQALRPALHVGDHRRQSASTRDMVFGVGELVHYLSQFMVLHPGDIINTGTPAGVALGRADNPYLTAGDVVRASIDGLGEQRNEVCAA